MKNQCSHNRSFTTLKNENVPISIPSGQQKHGRLYRMMKTFYKRWWIANRLYCFCKENGGVIWVAEDDFVSWIMESHCFPKWFIDAVTEGNIRREITNAIQECQDVSVNYISSDMHEFQMKIALSTRGREVYNWDYLVFGTPYSEKIWTGVIVATVAWAIIAMLAHYLGH